MADIMSGPSYPLAKAFEMAGWRIFAVDLMFGQEHDISKPSNQETIREQFKHADFIWAAIDCSDKSRIRGDTTQECKQQGHAAAVAK